jgi:hypothetical protein
MPLQLPRKAVPGALSFFLVLSGGTAACVGEMPVGEGTGSTSAAYGGQGEPPRSDGTCDTGLVVCGNVCTSTDSDAKNCGGCGNACASGESCARATCYAPAGSSSSGGGGSSSSSGGGSGSSSGGTSSSSSGVSPLCGPNLTQCGTACVDTSSDPNNCGACGTACAPTEFCARWTCLPQAPVDAGDDSDADADAGPVVSDAQGGCPQNYSLCGTTCVSLATDPANCGVCGNACIGAQMCIRATCQ